jgi:MFS family permease
MIRARSGPAVVLVMLSTVTVSYTLVLSMVNPALESLPLTASMLITGLAAAPLGRRLPTKLVMMLGSVPPAALFLIFAFAHSQRWEVLIAGAIGGLGFGIALSALSARTARDGLPAEHGWVVAFIALAIVAAIGVATCLLIPGSTPLRERSAQARREAEK